MSGVPEGSIIITPADMYAEVKELTVVVRELVASDKAESQSRNEDRARIAAVEVKVESKADNERVDKIDSRLTLVEKKLLLVTGAAAAVGAGFGTWLPRLLGS